MRTLSTWTLLVVVALGSSVTFADTRARPSADRAAVIERVVALVNGEPVMLSRVRRRYEAFLTTPDVRPSEAYRMALEAVITEELIAQAADRSEIRVSDAEVERAIENVRRQSWLTADAFRAAVRSHGFTMTAYRADVRRHLRSLSFVNARIPAGTTPSQRSEARRRVERLLGARLRRAARIEIRWRPSFGN